MRPGNLPRFLGLGAQKAGTTTLQMLLTDHPQVILPACKEVHFFSLNYGRGVDWYASQFLESAPGLLTGEITPYYLFHPQAPQRIHKLLPEARLIILLRDPVERSLSQYFHAVRLGLEPLSLEEGFAAEEKRLHGSDEMLQLADGRHLSHQEHSYLSRSRYDLQLDRYCRLFRREQMLILRSEDLFLKSQTSWERLLDFLELERWPLPQQQPRANAGRGEASQVPLGFRQSLRIALDSTYRRLDNDYGIAW